MKTQQTTSKTASKGGLASRLNIASWRKLHVATMTADEEAWPQREPSGNLGRIFILLLLLHVFIIGAVVLYNIITPKSKPVVTTETHAAPTDKAKTSTTPKDPLMPRSGQSPTAAAVAATPSDNKPAEIGSYEVRSGDNVPGIVAKLGITAEELIKQNNLESTELYPGRKLLYTKKSAPQLVTLAAAKAVPFSTGVSTGKPEPLKSITSPSSASSVSNKKDSAIDSSDSPPKAVLIKGPPVTSADSPPSPKTLVKDDTGTSAKPKTDTNKGAKTTPAKSVKDATGKRTHLVTSKDTLYSIAKKYGVKVDALQKANSIKDPTVLKDGSRLIIPGKN
ncbi:MAG: LysM peptidoglycan-binding domain-containing protein [Verrucomicrobiaceae bacterium]